ncbi:low molecular weight phosphotyrosine protein phosphatase, putative [Trichomonas vaginalis G3]|uniref:Low molecular weight phosphotyrosine protein phosphatase, putative n=1 Tax=Trichomonas vaginalis (strain ATCC PRA-98 / G3) TaxID=412133 RepID=A2DJ06_TRIV3|nr:non-membrane spanning protein tyrosine phosphatase protein [Trichomonas vaginalis G3]EAY19581.1 low molecular weight phosphotyrosine protein phosphatase, putative [Trichomonas vaginalis G3]KAI5515910.1 non-membrane spanning protein tyrosine phosphatase protein [Trichomonas vaginalis G3]|eukprot:XP_001580567.1 low molecular weight phosphotyrosine protein phosphatase [Trichomonas vaginalis G3]
MFDIDGKVSVLFVCQGNIIRSPLCEGRFRHEFGDRVRVDSAAVSSGDLNKHPKENAQKVAQAHGFDISGHISRLIKKEDFSNFSVIVSLDDFVHTKILKVKPKECRAKVVKFSKIGISNPWRQPLHAFNSMYGEIDCAWLPFIQKNFPKLLGN